MNLKTFVKVGNISNLSDARYCAGFGVQMLGFNFDPNQPDAITPDTASEIMGWVEVENFVLECGEMKLEDIQRLLADSENPFIQVDIPSHAITLANQGQNVILRLQINSQEDLSILELNMGSLDQVKYLLIESEVSDLYPDLDQKIVSINQIPVLKGYDNEASTILDQLNSNSFNGIALKGSAEEKPGYKDYDEFADILEILEDDE